MRSEKGITLVALIAVFVLLVVLAGISISLVLTDSLEKEPAVVQSNTTVQENVEEVENDVVEETNEVVENVVSENSNNVVDENVVEE